MSLSLPLVSICIPVYNAVEYIEETVESFLNQTYDNIEVILNDDCSTDGTWERLQKYVNTPKVRLYRNEKNAGIGANWNAVYQYAKGEYIVIANADDIHKDEFVKKAYTLITLHNVDYVSFKYQILNNSDGVLKDVPAQMNRDSGVVNGFDMISQFGAFHIIFTLFKKTLIENCKIDGLAFMNTQVCDYEFLLRYSYYNPKAYFSNEVIGYYRIHDTNNSKKPLGEMKSYFFDVLPYWDGKLKKYEKEHYAPGSYRKRRWNALKRYVKGILSGQQPFDFRLFKSVLIFYIKSI